MNKSIQRGMSERGMSSPLGEVRPPVAQLRQGPERDLVDVDDDAGGDEEGDEGQGEEGHEQVGVGLAEQGRQAAAAAA